MKQLKGIALLLFAIIISLGGIFEFVAAWYIGIAVGIVGLILVFANNDRGDSK